VRILILEDNLERYKVFDKTLFSGMLLKYQAQPNHKTVDWVKHTEEAIELLAHEEFDFLFLDHDLDGKVYQESGPGTGYEVAEWLADHPERKPKNIILHTLHQQGAINMKAKLPEAVYFPFVWNNTWDSFINKLEKVKIKGD